MARRGVLVLKCRSRWGCGVWEGGREGEVEGLVGSSLWKLCSDRGVIGRPVRWVTKMMAVV